MIEPPISVTAGVIVHDGRILVCQRAAGSPHAGKWELPGGKLEAGESLEECLHRELREELGIDVVVGRVLWRTLCPPQRPTIELTFFAIADYRGEPSNRVFAQIQWLSLAQLGELDLLEGDRELVAAVARGEISLPAATRTPPVPSSGE